MTIAFYATPTDTSLKRKLKCSGVSSIAPGFFVRVTTWPTSATDTGTAVLCGDALVPHMVVEVGLTDVDSPGVGCWAARDGVRARAGGAFAADDYLKLSGGKLIKASTGNRAYYQAIDLSTGDNDLAMVRWIGPFTVP